MNKKRLFSYLKNYAKLGVGIRSSRHAAAITYKGKIIALGRNSYKTHPAMLRWGRNDKSLYLHAEIAAIVDFLKNYPPQFAAKCELVVVRVNKHEELASSCPCKGCAKAISFYNFKQVVCT